MLGRSTKLFTCLVLGVFCVVAAPPTNAAPQGRLLLPGPNSTTTGPINEVHEYCLKSRGRRTVASFPTLPGVADLCPDGFLYVADQNSVYKLDRLTGQIVGSFSHQTTSPVSLACKPNGNLLMASDINTMTIDEYTPSGTRSAWVTFGTSKVIRNIRITPQATVAFLDGPPDLSQPPQKLVEYGLAGNYIRDLITTSSDAMDSFVFPSASEVLAYHRGSKCIKRYDSTTTPATFTSDFVCDAARISVGHLAVHPVDGSVYSTSLVSACVYGWNPNGTLQYNGQPLDCYDPLLYVGRPIVLAEDPLICVPTLSEWGLIAMGLLTVAAGTVVVMRRRRVGNT